MHSLRKILFLIGIGLTFATGVGVYFFRDNQQVKVSKDKIAEKCSRADYRYQQEFEKIYYRGKTNSAYILAELFGGKGSQYDLEILEAKMFSDGYSYAEIISIRDKAYDKYKHLRYRYLI